MVKYLPGKPSLNRSDVKDLSCDSILPGTLVEYINNIGVAVDKGLVRQEDAKHGKYIGSETNIVCEAHRHAKHAKSRGSGGMPPRKF